MDIVEQKQRGAGSVPFRAEPGDQTGAAGGPVAPASTPEAEETVFTVLAARARTRASAHLWLTAAIGGIDAVALILARPSLWWLSAACVAVGAYAVWGLADRALARFGGARPASWPPMALNLIRVSAIVVGVTAGVATAIGFLGAALGRGSLGW